MKKIVTVIGARPQIIKSAALSRAIKHHFSTEIEEIAVHTGQHYSKELSEQFYLELQLNSPKYNLNVGSASHGEQTALMIQKLEEVFIKEKPNVIVVYGDTNSTLAAAIAGSKLHIPIAHIEAGLRSFNKKMPEEINRIMCDHVSTLLFSPTSSGVENLKKEGFQLDNSSPYTVDNPKVYHCGDIMYDNSKFYSEQLSKIIPPYELMTLQSENYFVGTVHRPANTDNLTHLEAIFSSFIEMMQKHPNHLLYLPLHPRTRKKINELPERTKTAIANQQQLKIIPPVSYLNMIALLQNCELVVTDSGGLQKEAYFFQKPCVILREETEWTAIVEQGCGVLTGANHFSIISGVESLLANENLVYPNLFGDGNAAEFMLQEIINQC